MRQDDVVELVQAAQRLETANLATRISQLIGMPIEKALAALPGHWSTVVTRMTRTALQKALDGALYTLESAPRQPSNYTHKVLAGVSGAVGGSFGIAALAVELPVSATLMLRSIADIARSQGEYLADIDTKMACLTVFALSGGSSNDQESADTSYYAVRSFLSKALGDTGNHIAVHGLSKEGAPALIKFVNAVAGRFSLPVSEKLAAQSLPALGAIGGASVNLLFMTHYQQMAKAHFTIRRLEKLYGQQAVNSLYVRVVEENSRTQGRQWSLKE